MGPGAWDRPEHGFQVRCGEPTVPQHQEALPLIHVSMSGEHKVEVHLLAPLEGIPRGDGDLSCGRIQGGSRGGRQLSLELGRQALGVAVELGQEVDVLLGGHHPKHIGVFHAIVVRIVQVWASELASVVVGHHKGEHRAARWMRHGIRRALGGEE